MIIYISGKYSDDSEEKINDNILIARKHAIAIWEAGLTALCPHLNTAFFEKDCNIKYESYIEGDLQLLEGCDAILMLHNWTESKGANEERNHAEKHHIPVFYSTYLDDFDYLKNIFEYFKDKNKNSGIKYDDDKLRLDLVDYNQINKLAYILTMGAKKYSDSNWMKVEPFNSRYFAALLRHLFAWQAGFKIDKESGKSHLDHAMANLMFLMWGEDNGKK
jgi:hypothetical protein